MSNPLIVVDKIVEYFVGKVCQLVGRHVGFLFHYKRNVKNLEDERNNLQQQRSNVQEKVDQAGHSGEAIDNNVSDWLQEANEASQGVVTFMDVKAVKENMQCLNFSCPDFISRYRLSKQAKNKAVSIKQLAEKGSEIGTVSHPREDPPELELPSSRDYEDFHSRQKVFKDIVEALKDSNVNMVGVYGTGGVGKTTMVEKVGKQLKEDGTFDQVVMAVVSQDAIVIKIQGQLADALNIKLEGETEVRKAKQLWKRLDNGKKNLILLDDVWQQLDLEKIGIPIAIGNKRCKVVLTSRKRNVLENMGVQEAFHIEFLSEQEAWNLFKMKVGNHVDSYDQRLRETAWAVCNECKGLPVAINALGATLKGSEDMHAWEDALYKLKNSMLKEIEGIDPGVYASLRLSYDRLETIDAKLCFLLCCLFAEDADISIDDLVRYYMAERTLHRYQMVDTLQQALDRVCTVVSTLKRSCLLLDGKWKNHVKMHDVVRDVAISIAEDEKSFLVKHGVRYWPEKATYEHCSIISLMPQDMGEFPNELICPKLHTLRLDCTVNNKFPLHIPDSFFGGTENLMGLDLNGVPMLSLPASLAKLAKLHMLCLNNCKLGDIAILKDLKNHLEILSLRNSDIKELPPEIGELTRLRLLDMRDCWGLQMIPRGVMSKLVLLEELYMPMTFNRWEGTSAEREISNVSLDELMSLTHLTTLHICIEDPALLPKRFTFENLARFGIIVGATSPVLGSEGTLGLENIHVENVLEFLLGNPTRKQSTRGNGFYPSTSFNHLGTLRVTNCRLKYLFSPSCARLLVQLKSLQISNCSIMEGVIGTEGENDEDIVFRRLKFLDLGHLANLISFYPKKSDTATSSGSSSTHAQMALFNDKAAFPALERLEIDSVPKITEIWNKQILPIPETATESFCRQLSEMTIRDCVKLVNVVGGCPKIEAMEMEKKKGKVVDDYVTRFPKLTTLELSNLPNLESFCNSFVRCEGQVPLFDHQAAFPALERLEIDSVPKITEIWNKQILPIPETATESFCRQLSEMTIRDCVKLVNVVGGCPKIEAMEMEKKKGKVVDDYVTRFPKLTTLELSNLPNLESFCNSSVRCEGQVPLFDHQAAFPALGTLLIDSLPEITEIWNKQILPIPETATESSFCQLWYMHIKSCGKLMNVVGGCPKIEAMEMEKKKGKVVDDYAICFPKLTTLKLSNLPNLESFCNSSVRCEGQVPLFDHQAAFPALERLEIDSVPKITEIWNKQILPIPETATESFCRQLSEMTIRDCVKLVNVVGGCPKIEAMEMEKKKGKVVDDYVTRFPKLTTLELSNLPNLESFCNSSVRCEGQVPLFDHQAAFPALGTLLIDSLPEITEIWNKQILPIPETATESSFCQLWYMHIKSCGKLMNVVGGCPKIEAMEMEKKKGKVVDDYAICFPKLTTLKLSNLPNLESFCNSSVRCEGQVPLFDHQAAFPALERLEIDSVPKITEIWNKQILPIPETATESFCRQLSEMTIRDCVKLVNVVGGCPKIEAMEMEKKKGKVVDDYVTRFPKLTTLELSNLPNLESFCNSSVRCEGQVPLFDHQAAFPALGTLLIDSLPEITEIWNKQILPIPETATESSFCQLWYMHIKSCGKLMNVVGGCPKIEAMEMEKKKGKVVDDYAICFPKLTTLKLSNLPNLESFCNSSVRCDGQVPLFDHQAAFPALERLEIRFVPEITEIWNKQILPIPEIATESFCCQLSEMTISDCDKLVNVVGGCPKIEAIEMEKQKGKVVDDYATCFPKLTTLKLDDLPNLESFCNSSVRCEAQVPLFGHQVAFPALEGLDIRTLPNITDIWDKKIRPVHQPFCPLHDLYVEDCGKLVYVVPSNMLPQLCNLESVTLDSCPMAEVIVDLEKKEEGTQEAANNTIVPFPKLSFLRLKRLQKIKGFCAFRSEEQRLFNTKVAFPKLEELIVDTFREIALKDTPELSLKRLAFYECEEVSTVVSPHLFRRLRFVDLLNVRSCRGAREVFHLDGQEVGEGQLCVGQLTQVRKLYLEDLPQLTCLWNKDPHRLLGLQSLEYLTIKKCPLLANLFTASVAKALGGLKVFYLSSCSTIEEVITTDEGHTDVLDDDREIVFPKLEWLILKDLSNLKSFCTSNHNFNFPSLKRVVLKRCPKVQAFTSGSVRMPQILLSTRGNECLMIEDLNKHLEQQHLKGDQETILDGEMKGDEDRFSYWWNLKNY